MVETSVDKLAQLGIQKFGASLRKMFFLEGFLSFVKEGLISIAHNGLVDIYPLLDP